MALYIWMNEKLRQKNQVLLRFKLNKISFPPAMGVTRLKCNNYMVKTLATSLRAMVIE